MFSGLTNKNAFLRLVTIIVTGMFLLQSAIASVSLVKHSENGAFRELCATSQPSSGDNGGPAFPTAPANHHGACCILHAAFTCFAPKISATYLTRLNFPENKFELWASESNSRHRLEPSRAPQSPRAPPHRG